MMRPMPLAISQWLRRVGLSSHMIVRGITYCIRYLRYVVTGSAVVARGFQASEFGAAILKHGL